MMYQIRLFAFFLMVLSLSTNLQAQKNKKVIEVSRSIYIDIPREELWKITALDFGGIDKWISGVNQSTSEGNGEGLEGAVCTQRVCDPSYKGFKETTERFVEYDGKSYRFKYQIAQGMPSFMKGGSNEWTHEPEGKGTRITMHTKMEVKGFMGWLMKGTMRKKTGKILEEALEELKVYAETGEQHPRKKEAIEKYEKELAKKAKKQS